MSQLIPQFDQVLLSATEQALGLVLCAEVSQRREPVVLDLSVPVVSATIHLASESDDLRVILMLRCARVCAVQMVTRMLHMSEDEVAVSHLLDDVMGEIVNVLGGGVKTAIEERISDCVLGLPKVQEMPGNELPPPPAHAMVLHFVAGENVHFSVMAQVAHFPLMLS